jgi:hypothetical protein
MKVYFRRGRGPFGNSGNRTLDVLILYLDGNLLKHPKDLKFSKQMT